MGEEKKKNCWSLVAERPAAAIRLCFFFFLSLVLGSARYLAKVVYMVLRSSHISAS